MAFQAFTQDRSGQNMGNGIMMAAQGIAQGMSRYYQKKEEAEQVNNAADTFSSMAQQNPFLAQALGVKDPKDTGALKTAIKAAGGPQQFLQVAAGTQEMIMRAKAQEQQQLMFDQQQRARAAMMQAAGGTANTAQAIDGGATFGQLPQPGQVDPNSFLRSAIAGGGNARDAAYAAEIMQRGGRQVAGETTAAQQNAEAIIRNELAAGSLQPDPRAVATRRAKLLANGGMDRDARYFGAGTFVDRETGGNAIAAVRNSATGEIGYHDTDGTFKQIPASYKPTTAGNTDSYLDPSGFEKLRAKVIEGERSIGILRRYLGGFENLNQGVAQLADRATGAMKTLFTKEPLTDQELAVGLTEARQQALVGRLRTTIVGPGVMTEQDALRIISALGGDVSVWTNKELVAQAIGEVLQDKIAEYEDDLTVYNTQAAGKYTAQTGAKQRKKVNVEYSTKRADAAAKASLPTGVSQVEWDNMTAEERELFQ